jgi:hypothetical protein
MRVSVCGFLLLLASAPTLAQAQREAERDTMFAWEERIPEGAWLRVRTLRGSIEVRDGDGRVAEVRAVKRSRRGVGRGALSRVTFEVRRDGDNVTVCAIWPTTRECDEDGYDSRGGHDDEDDDARHVSADFFVRLPRDVRLHAGTGNGAVRVEGTTAEVRASSGNGRVEVLAAGGAVSASSGNGDVTVDGADAAVTARSGNGAVRVSTARGPVSASSGNGRIDVRMRELRGADMEFRTGNGSVTVALPRDFEGQVEAHSGHGEVRSDFPITLTGPVRTGYVRGVIGRGGPTIRMSTGNGRLELRRIE